MGAVPPFRYYYSQAETLKRIPGCSTVSTHDSWGEMKQGSEAMFRKIDLPSHNAINAVA
jgi:hypothetical protein